jgi:hypothetical protein
MTSAKAVGQNSARSMAAARRKDSGQEIDRYWLGKANTVNVPPSDV